MATDQCLSGKKLNRNDSAGIEAQLQVPEDSPLSSADARALGGPLDPRDQVFQEWSQATPELCCLGSVGQQATIPLLPKQANRKAQTTNAPLAKGSAWWAGWWLGACLALGSLLLFRAVPASWFGSAPEAPPALKSRTEPHTKKIEEIRVGDRVVADNPTEERDLSLGEDVDPKNWRKIELRAPKRDGSWAEVVLLRPVSWLEEGGARVGETVEIAVPECAIDGHAKVLSIGPCPSITPGKGHVVTGTFKHISAKAINLYVEGQAAPIGTTPNHLFWSQDQGKFIRADELRLGERLRALQGQPRVVRVVSHQGVVPVYNLEVDRAHVYLISSDGILVHNSEPWRTGYVYEITYVEDGVKKVYVGSALNVYERLWTNRTGSSSQGNRGRDILRAHSDAQVTIWEVELPRGRSRSPLNTQEQHAIEDVIKDPARGPSVLDNAIKGRSKRPRGAYTNSEDIPLPKVEQQKIKAEIEQLLAAGRKLPASTPADTPIERLSKYDLDTLRYGDRRGRPVAGGPQARVAERARLLCGM